jgi:protein-L-isoaspartate(D-aspartate) O-methyltransferase
VEDARILEAFRRVPRAAFLPRRLRDRAMADVALPIDCGQTISQPSMVALMLAELAVAPESRVLEIGAGSGYAAAVLSHLAQSVYGVERHLELAQRARQTLSELGRDNVIIHHGDGAASVPQGQFDRILVSAAAPHLPAALAAALPRGGRLVAPIGEADRQVLVTYERGDDDVVRSHETVACIFVPLLSPALRSQTAQG